MDARSNELAAVSLNALRLEFLFFNYYYLENKHFVC